MQDITINNFYYIHGKINPFGAAGLNSVDLKRENYYIKK